MEAIMKKTKVQWLKESLTKSLKEAKDIYNTDKLAKV
jgi:hypothetical protein